MKLTLTAKKMNISPSFTEYAEEKLGKLDKFFDGESKAKIVLTEYKNFIVTELTVYAGSLIYRSEQSAADKKDALDACIDKIIRQIRKNKTKIGKRLKEGALQGYEDVVEETSSYDVIKTKKFVMHPMTVDEAILQMNLLGHQFFMFTNAESGAINVVYRREDDRYAILEPTNE